MLLDLKAAKLARQWGKNDSFFVPLGAEAFKRDVPSAVAKFLDNALCSGSKP